MRHLPSRKGGTHSPLAISARYAREKLAVLESLKADFEVVRCQTRLC